MQYEYIDDQDHLVEFCESISDAKIIAFDTEFVSEDSYRPHLCLLQVAADGKLAVIDPLVIDDLSVFWELLTKPGHDTVVHAGREEFRFCVAAINKRPNGWFDAQLAAGFVGLEYPASYSTLATRLLGKSLAKGETRTDWRRRPLSSRQIEYALQDVLHLEPIRDHLVQRLDELDRRAWFEEDTERWQTQIESDDGRDRWRRLSGISGLSSRSLAIARELWRWRDEEARRRNTPPKRILRDDLIVELARRKSADRKGIGSIRGMQRSKRQLPEIAERIARALELPNSDCPKPLPRGGNNGANYTLLGQFLNTALGAVCRSKHLAPTIVGTVQDVRDLVAYELVREAGGGDPPPSLATGWRAEVVGRVLEDLLAGKTTIRVVDAQSEQPLSFE